MALLIVLTAGAFLSATTWPAERSTQTLWFWIRTLGLPFLAWLALFSGWLFLLGNRLRNALADNAAIDLKERRLHEDASVPFTVVGQSWCLSGVPEHNRVEDAMSVGEQEGDRDATGALVIPEHPFVRGNYSDEVFRHASVLEWLLVKLIKPLANQLPAGTNPNSIAAQLRIDSELPPEGVRQSVVRAWAALGMTWPETVQLVDSMSLYSLDDWLDKRARSPLRLAIAVQLRGAISGGLQAGQAEGGAALLLADLPHPSNQTDVVCVHRPARSPIEALDTGISNAMRWGHCDDSKIAMRWGTGLAEPLAKALKSLDSPVSDAPFINLARTIGDVGVATPWLSVALAAHQALGSSGPQMILDQHDGELVAVICRKKT
jgi:hypothetical protein